MRAFTWCESSVCLGKLLHDPLDQFPCFTDEQTETHREKRAALNQQVSSGAGARTQIS